MPGNKRDLRFLRTTFFLSELFNSSFLMIIITTMISLVNVVMNAFAHRLLAATTLVPEREDVEREIEKALEWNCVFNGWICCTQTWSWNVFLPKKNLSLIVVACKSRKLFQTFTMNVTNLYQAFSHSGEEKDSFSAVNKSNGGFLITTSTSFIWAHVTLLLVKQPPFPQTRSRELQHLPHHTVSPRDWQKVSFAIYNSEICKSKSL